MLDTEAADGIRREPGAAANRSHGSRGDDSPPPTYSHIERQTSFTSSISQTSSMCMFLLSHSAYVFSYLPTKGDARLCFCRCQYVARYDMFVNNFLAPVQVRLSPNFVNHTLGHKGRGD